MLWPIAAGASSLAELDAILTEAGSLREFLSPRRAKLRDRYYEALKKYYGDSAISSSDYQTVISQLTKMDSKIPGLGERLWETTGLGEKFSISVDSPSYGRHVNGSKWKDHFEAWRLSQLKKAGRYYQLPVELRSLKLLDDAKWLTGEMAQHAQRMAQLPRRERAKQSAEFYSKLKKTTRFRDASSYVLHRYLQSEAIQDQFLSRDADLVLNLLRSLDNDPAQLLEDYPSDFPKAWLSLLKPQILKVSDLLADHSLFPQTFTKTRSGKLIPVSKTGVVDYDFVPFPRRFHGVWKGFPIGECVAGKCLRFGTVAIAGTQLYSVERSGRSRGFVQVVPGEMNGKIYGSVDFGAAPLARKVVGEADSASSAKTIYERALPELAQRLPPTWNGLVVGEDRAINNAGVIPVVHASPTYLNGETVGKGSEFKVQDPVSDQMGTPEEEKSFYGNRMIFDAQVPGNADRALIRLVSDPHSKESRAGEPARPKLAMSEWSPEMANTVIVTRTDIPTFLEFAKGLPLEKKAFHLQEVVPGQAVDFLKQLDAQNLPELEYKVMGAAIAERSLGWGLSYLDRHRFDRYTLDGIADNFIPPIMVGLALSGPAILGDYLSGNFPSWTMGLWASALTWGEVQGIYANVRRILDGQRDGRAHLMSAMRFAERTQMPLSRDQLNVIANHPRAKRECQELARRLAARVTAGEKAP